MLKWPKQLLNVETPLVVMEPQRIMAANHIRMHDFLTFDLIQILCIFIPGSLEKD